MIFLYIVAYLVVGYFIAPWLDRFWFFILKEEPNSWATYEEDAKFSVGWIYVVIMWFWPLLLAFLAICGSAVGIYKGVGWLLSGFVGNYWWKHSSYMAAYYDKKTRPLGTVRKSDPLFRTPTKDEATV